MKKSILSCMTGLLLVIVASGTLWGRSLPLPPSGSAEADTVLYKIYKGKVVDSKTNVPLVYAEVVVQGENTATITNSQGEFVIKVNRESKATHLVISHLGYKNLVVPLASLKSRHNILRAQQAAISLSQVFIHPSPADLIVKRALESIRTNYPGKPSQMTGFYREFIKKRRHYVSLSEAIVEIYKASYTSLSDDQVKIIRGRKGSNVKRMDTLLFKLRGGPSTGLLLDVIKNPFVLMNQNMLRYYRFSLVNEVKKNDKIYYVIHFEPIDKRGVPRYTGNFYIDAVSYALASADFSLNLDNPVAAARLFIKKKPAGVKVAPAYARYRVTYRQQNGKWYFQYAKGEVSFKVKWPKRLFSSVYTTSFEIAITDRQENHVVRFKPSERFRQNQVFAETVQAFSNKDYWGKYNYIEPNQSIESAIRKFKRILKK